MSPEIVTAAGIAFAVITAGVVLFQVALALGAPWGEYAMGGRLQGRFPPAMRIAALVQAVALAVLAVIVVSHAGIVVPDLTRDVRWLIWVPVVVSALAFVLNVMTPSPRERRIWAPVGALLLLTSLVVALSPS